MRYQYCVVGPVATLFPAWSLDRGKHQDEGAGGKEEEGVMEILEGTDERGRRGGRGQINKKCAGGNS